MDGGDFDLRVPWRCLPQATCLNTCPDQGRSLDVCIVRYAFAVAARRTCARMTYVKRRADDAGILSK